MRLDEAERSAAFLPFALRRVPIRRTNPPAGACVSGQLTCLDTWMVESPPPFATSAGRRRAVNTAVTG